MAGAADGKRFLTGLTLVLVALAFIACGGESQTPGEGEPKRALDPRGEALRYFPATTETIALVDTADADALSALDRSMSAVPGWRSIRDRVRHSLRQAGIDPAEILELSRNPADDIELPAPEIAFGTVPGSGTDEERALMTLATEQGVALDSIFKEAADAGGLEAAGEFDGARIYRGPDLDFAVRDGVLIAAPDVNRLQQAIARRDGDRTAQLDDAPITALLNSLPQGGALRAYSGAGPTADRMLTLITGAMAASSSDTDTEAMPTETGTAVEGALAAGSKDGRMAIDLVVKTESSEALAEDTPEDEPSPEEEPTPISIDPDDIEQALSELPPGAPLRDLSSLAPLAGAAWVEGDQLRARLITVP